MTLALRTLLFVVGAALIVGAAFFLVRAVIEGEWLFVGVLAAIVGLELAYTVWRAKRRVKAEDEEAERMAREVTDSTFTAPSGSGG